MIFLGNLFDDASALEWILNQDGDDSIEELTSPMIEKLIRESKNVVVLFCKYAGYMLIAITHTCYMLRHYSGSANNNNIVNTTNSKTTVLKTTDNIQQNNTNGDIFLNGTIDQKPNSYLPPDKVRA